jgi:hypothetical protein
MLLRISLFVFIAAGLPSCMVDDASQPHSSFASFEVPDEFADYWYSGEGEISSYTLDIFRYGEKRRGTAVNVFVTEDFSAADQVKLDDPSAAGDDRVSVLKLNQLYKIPYRHL